MAWPNGTRYKTYGPGITFPPADPNAIQDQILQVAGYRGVSNITASESRSNVAYGLLGTPDQIAGIVLPTDGLIAVAYQATWQQSNATAARAAIFIGANQLQVVASGPNVQGTAPFSAVATDTALASSTFGLVTDTTGATGSDVTTGQIVGWSSSCGPCYIFAAAGTYTVSVQFKASAGSVTVKNRRLWVWTSAFS